MLVPASSTWRCNCGTAKFIALIGETSRRFEEFDPEISLNCAMGHDATLSDRVSPFFTVLRGSNWIEVPLRKKLGPPKNCEKVKKNDPPPASRSCLLTYETDVQRFRV